MSETDWLRQIVKFIVSTQHLEASLNSFTAYNSSQLLKEFALADEVYCINQEDNITSSLVSTQRQEHQNSYVDLFLVNHLFQLTEPQEIDIHVLQENRVLAGNIICAVGLPIHIEKVKGCYLIAYKHKCEFSNEYFQFLRTATVRLQDIHTNKRLYSELENFKRTYHTILETITQSILFIDELGKYCWLNERASRLLALPYGTISPYLAQTAMARLIEQAENRLEIEERAKTVLVDEEESFCNWIFASPEKKIYKVQYKSIKTQSVSGKVWIFNDVTLEYEYEEKLKSLNQELMEKSMLADEQNRAKSQFLANMSHEIRTPMNGIIGMTSLLLESEASSERTESLQIIKQSANILLELINEILDFSKIEAGKIELEEHPFILSQVLRGCIEILSLKAKEKGLKLDYSIDSSIPLTILSDSFRLRQILINLIGNAIKFSDKGGIDVDVTNIGVENEQIRLQFSVKDEGIGIPTKKLEKLFQPFSQADSSTTRKYGGTGLGLAISALLVERLNGKIWVESEIGKGSTFYFTILVKEDKNIVLQEPVSQSVSEYRINSDLAKNNIKILVAEDNIINQKVIKKTFSKLNKEIDIVSDGQEAIEAAREGNYDIIFMDLHMPVTDGIEATKEVRKLLLSKQPFIVAMTAAAYEEDRLTCISAGMNDYISKPFNLEHFYSKLEHWINLCRQQ